MEIQRIALIKRENERTKQIERKKEYRSIKCFYCGREGYMTKECRQKKNKEEAVCFNCKGNRHRRANCFFLKKENKKENQLRNNVKKIASIKKKEDEDEWGFVVKLILFLSLKKGP
jgi:hypothetical protein